MLPIWRIRQSDTYYRGPNEKKPDQPDARNARQAIRLQRRPLEQPVSVFSYRLGKVGKGPLNGSQELVRRDVLEQCVNDLLVTHTATKIAPQLMELVDDQVPKIDVRTRDITHQQTHRSAGWRQG